MLELGSSPNGLSTFLANFVTIHRPFPRPHPAILLKVLATPAKQAPSFGPVPSTSKKAKASVSKYRPKTPLVAQKAKFSIDVGVTPPETITIYHPLAGPPP
ncbi:hypothetical protein PAXRUDRAFT_18864 [Paxillus rubicundulus Ve08.2h10]|uniref:Unplaced genomic scaffold scaffold_3180, whole genome shotgun sequence n=1 Tax=Paxillus rubicundulus Ve08.2h10 TaxID=930991 RepID=A0A0D0DDS5_9AGAM|nr:hypothetical protein PAXRUDRAFT_18864 [Paxillus rubicundulus Ve08.2h10]